MSEHDSTAVTARAAASAKTAVTDSAASKVPPPKMPNRSLGELVASASADLSALVRKEIELAKLELKQEAVSAGKGAGALGAAAFAGVLGLIFLSIALAYAIGKVLPLGVGFLLVGVLYILVAAIAALVGKKSFGKVGPPQKTIETVKDDIAWAKHPTIAPTHRAPTTV